MAVTLKEIETAPAAYPAITAELSAQAAAFDAGAVWQRIEAHCAHRWTPREVFWTVEGVGDWEPPISPAQITATEIWDGSGYIPATVGPSPYGGLCLELVGPYRITATVGGGDLPPAVSEAFRRLIEYMAETNEEPGAASYSINLGSGSLERSWTRVSGWAARALDLSGAADLLRPWKRRF